MRFTPGLLLPLACATMISACQDRSPAEPSPPAATDAGATRATPASAGTAPRWDASVVWSGDLNACRRDANAATRECLLDSMRASQASPAAIDAAAQLSSAGELAFVSAWHELDGIGVATVVYPFRANTNEGTRLIDSQGKRIDVDADPSTGDTAVDPALQALLQAHPGTTPFAPAQSAGSTALEGGGVRLLYITPLRECHACADVAKIQISYDFDAERRFISRQLQP